MITILVSDEFMFHDTLPLETVTKSSWKFSDLKILNFQSWRTKGLWFLVKSVMFMPLIGKRRNIKKTGFPGFSDSVFSCRYWRPKHIFSMQMAWEKQHMHSIIITNEELNCWVWSVAVSRGCAVFSIFYAIYRETVATSGSLGKVESNSNTCKRVKLHLHCVCFVVCLFACFSLALAQLGLWSHWGLAS